MKKKRNVTLEISFDSVQAFYLFSFFSIREYCVHVLVCRVAEFNLFFFLLSVVYGTICEFILVYYQKKQYLEKKKRSHD